jgi:beta-galactosidase
MEPSGTLVRFSAPEFALTFDRLNGVITSFSYRGTKLLDRGPLPDFWRAVTDNDQGAWKSLGAKAAGDPTLDIMVWRHAGRAWHITGVDIDRVDASRVRISVKGDLPLVGARFAMTYEIDGGGHVDVSMTYDPSTTARAMIPRVGTELAVSAGLERIVWYGRGPSETYVDRRFEPVGQFTSTVRDQWVDYSRPQENGNKTDVRWIALTNAEGVGLMAIGHPLLSVGASHVTKEDLERAAYSFELPARAEITLNLDLAQMGVGGINSWSADAYPMEPYRLPADRKYEYRYRLAPVAGDTAAALRAAGVR